ncbi:NAD(P)H-dependent oxidoreductase [Nocardioides zeae]|uniref:NAD(P)H-dependent oxidoreductase n=1 Tax=Nocardioides imazamoxiresistens TaxID=3231893 RepID=A0ABU3PX11_9ACTN|nr:NAD(P)H-dependent oxidoreductase [Nocardioides zeae]MDT9593769.1 NAD(P)H-dependent oxidoreductase [Nocardioides zeae]
MTDLRVLLISASVREQSASGYLLPWLAEVLGATTGITTDVLDLAVTDPGDGRGVRPGGGDAGPLDERIARADAYVLLTPEYNHSYPASLKHLLDNHYGVWGFKPATMVAYGVHGGLLAVEHLRGVLAELRVVGTRRVVGLAAPWQHLDDAGAYRPDDGTRKAVEAAVDELVWWADLLREARETRELPR